MRHSKGGLMMTYLSKKVEMMRSSIPVDGEIYSIVSALPESDAEKPILITQADARKYLGVSKYTWERYLKQLVPTHKFGRRLYYKKVDLDSVVDKMATEPLTRINRK